MNLQLVVLCVLEENGEFFLVTKVDDLITLKVPILESFAEFLLAIGASRCS
ncbi:exosporium protein G [Bacillus cytotoxicus]|uniref:Exosporium protein G n=2 Tax=Bacillus cytotoxicus TaxID=580165 RepID=A0AAX2CFY6_9BACI|nr:MULTISPECIES: hypothetical protein [Bacillus cereus group]ABS21915.1 conserved hypothetical protein [Bacillus cytotoxicus NVH 391-98]AWC28527.1 exosporium protein G [Bacillus cytotoxicus]AWC40089.1 exosporium protein G [Bacillus cytotoxicus]AWC44604.1 exosporium protein G [Bacillus cytotoxicus]AWC48020.1 exosporium protein G [Bacillus cytotoxicus]